MHCLTCVKFKLEERILFCVEYLQTLKVYFLNFNRVGQYRGSVTRYFFSTVIGTVGTFKKMYRFWYRRYFLDRFTRYFGNFF